MTRELSSQFDAKNMRFNDHATPIMRELQAISGNEGEQVLKALLDEYHVSLIPSEDFPDFVAYLKMRNANSLRNMLSKLGWEARRYRFAGAQHRVWCHKSLQVENGRVSHPELARTFHKLAEENNYTWFGITYYVRQTWNSLLKDRLLRGSLKRGEDYSALSVTTTFTDDDNKGPFKASYSHLRLQARTEDELAIEESESDEADVHYINF
jgi:hypothetical protein